MRERKDSGVEWIGEIPKEWKICRLKNYAYIMNGADFKDIQDDNGDYPVIGSGGEFDRATKYLYDGESVLLGRKGTIDKPRYINGTFWTVDTMYYTKIKDIGIAKYLYYLCTQIQFDYYQYGSAVPSMTQRDLNSVVFPLPEIVEQENIVNYLDSKCSKIDEIIEKQQAIIEKLKEYKISIITEAVTSGINPDVEMKDSGSAWFGDIPTHWECVVSKIVFEKVSDINHFMPESVDSGYPYLMIGDLRGRVSDIDFKKCKKISKEDFDSLKQKMKSKKGDVIFARYATIGTVCYVDIDVDFLVSYACVTVRPNKKLYGEYLYYYFKSCAFRENVKQFINSNTQENVGIEALCRTKITLPPYKEQKLIVDYLNKKCKNISIRIEMKRQLIDKLQEYKKSLIYEVVTGKKEV